MEKATRATNWQLGLNLPCNRACYSTLCMRPIDVEPVERALCEVSDLLPNQRERRSASRILSSLFQHQPLLRNVPFVPYLCAAVTRGTNSNPCCVFEATVYFLLNTVSSWLTCHPFLPVLEVQHVDKALQEVNPILWMHLHHQCSVEPCDYLWPVLQTFLIYNFPERCWCELFDEFLLRNDGYAVLCAASLSVVLSLGDVLLQCKSPQDVQKAIGQQVPSVQACRKLIFRFTERFSRVSGGEISLIPPPPTPYYPLIRVGKAQNCITMDKHLKLKEIEESEAAVYRRIQNELGSLSAGTTLNKFFQKDGPSALHDPALSSRPPNGINVAVFHDKSAHDKSAHDTSAHDKSAHDKSVSTDVQFTSMIEHNLPVPSRSTSFPSTLPDFVIEAASLLLLTDSRSRSRSQPTTAVVDDGSVPRKASSSIIDSLSKNIDDEK